MTTLELVDPEAQQRFEQAAVRTGEARVVDGRVIYAVGSSAAQASVGAYELGIQQVHELMAEAFDRRAL